MSYVAVVPKLDTGRIVQSTGEQIGSECEVLCDRFQTKKIFENVDLVTYEMGIGHDRFDAGELDCDLIEFQGKTFSHLRIRVEFRVDHSSERRIAKFQFLLKPNQKSKVGDPFYVQITNGHPIVKMIDKITA